MSRQTQLVAFVGLAVFIILNAAILASALSFWREARTVQLHVQRQPTAPLPQLTPMPGLTGPAIVDGYFVNVKGERWPVTDQPSPTRPVVPAPGGPLRQLPDGRWAFRGSADYAWEDLAQAERDILRPPALCPDGWYSNPATAGTLCPEAIEFMANYDQYRAAFEADYYRRYGR